MFTMMNYERLSIGIQGIGCAETSYQNARAYARDRLQGRAPKGAQAPMQVADPILMHPDVRRMLLTMKALNEGGRAFSCYVGQLLDLGKYSIQPGEQQRAQALAALLTPVCKAFFTDTGLESCIHGQQVFGGHGYIREWGQEQLVRDVRIAQIYEGTNGVQALDLLGRKVVGDGGAMLATFCGEALEFVQHSDSTYCVQITQEVGRLQRVSALLLDRASNDPTQIGAASVEYLHLFGYVAYAYMWARMMSVAEQRMAEDLDFYSAKLATGQFFFSRLLPRTLSLEATILAGAEPLYGLLDAQF
jgi:hypothetical protein